MTLMNNKNLLIFLLVIGTFFLVNVRHSFFIDMEHSFFEDAWHSFFIDVRCLFVAGVWHSFFVVNIYVSRQHLTPHIVKIWTTSVHLAFSDLGNPQRT